MYARTTLIDDDPGIVFDTNPAQEGDAKDVEGSSPNRRTGFFTGLMRSVAMGATYCFAYSVTCHELK